VRLALLLTTLTGMLWASRAGYASHALAQSEPPNWVASLVELRPGPLDLSDPKASLEQRIALAEALGEHGPAEPAIASLTAALEAEPPPPSLLREALALSLARRLGRGPLALDPLPVPAPVATVLSAARMRGAKTGAARPASKPGAAWLEHPRSGAAMVRAFLRETEPATLRAMARKLGALHLLGLAPPADPYVLTRALCDPETAPNALLMLAADAGRSPNQTTRRLLRAALAGAPCSSSAPSVPDDDPEVVSVRILAALGLAALDDIEAVPPLRHALRSPFARVRLAAAAALSMLATEQACAALTRHAYVENSVQVRRALACTPRGRD